MRYSLENEKLKIEIDSFGAELKSVTSKETDRNYMWYADSKYWGRTSPVLFPFVGSMKNKSFTYQGKIYPMGQHGFARDCEHTLLSQDKDSIWFEFKSSADTLAKYPFEFVLRIGYILDENRLRVLWEVENPSEQTLPFSIGAHPAFLCPENKDGYRIFFGQFQKGEHLAYQKDKESTQIPAVTPLNEIHHHGNTVDTGLAITEDILLPLTDGKAAITPDFFDRCTYMIEGDQANAVALVDPDDHAFVTVYFDTPLFAIWSPEKKNAPFICIEPWFGRCDHVDFNGTLEEREYTNHLEAKGTFETNYVIEFN